MGLDGVELVMALEEGFGVTITDADAEACVTPAIVIDLIFGKLRASDERVFICCARP
jgi:acyl carrier protein